MKQSDPRPERAPRRPGRPREFDREAALHQAMLLFWRHGYEATPLSDLTAAMGISPPSLYAAFGDKRRLFLEAVSRYCSGPVTAQAIIDEAHTSADAARRLLESSAVAFTGADTPRGCLLASGAISCSAASADVQGELAAIRQGIETRLRERIERDVDAGALGPETDAESLAAHVMAVIQGMSTLARDGAPRERLVAVAEVAMRAWPSPAPGAHGSRSPLTNTLQAVST